VVHHQKWWLDDERPVDLLTREPEQVIGAARHTFDEVPRMGIRVPDVPDRLPDPLERSWPAGDPIIRCHPVVMAATEFNASNVSPRLAPS
jgi:hypothetical protein